MTKCSIFKMQVCIPLLLILFGIISRASLLEFNDLIDPTEARYASVAQQMLLHNNWITPMLPMPEGLSPYLGKPPLHFWLTAISYKFFGVDEWTSRLPSFLAAMIILFGIWVYCKKAFDREIAITSIVIALSSLLLFFLAGASVVDVTLTAFVSLSIIILFPFIILKKYAQANFLLAAIFGGMAFLVKGPIAIALIFLPFILFSLIRKDFGWLKKMPFIKSMGLFLLVVLPWFLLCELENPGFLKYFVWTENIGRYLFKEYGDRYGTGHQHFYGMSFVMLAGAFLPWTPVLIWIGIKQGFKKISRVIYQDDILLFTFLWAISSALFFLLVRQLHMMYILPSVPGLAILTAKLLKTYKTEQNISNSKYDNWEYFVLPAAIFGLITFALFTTYSTPAIISTLASLAFVIYLIREIKNKVSSRSENIIYRIASASIVTYVSILLTLTPYIDHNRSAKYLVQIISEVEKNNQSTPVVGVFSNNTYSHYWTADAGLAEIDKAVKVIYLKPELVSEQSVDYIILKKGTGPKDINQYYAEIKNFGKWQLLKRQR